MFKEYKVVLSFTRDILGTNPADPSIHEQHIIQKQRKLIQEKGSYNAEINKYLEALQITEERGKLETDKLLDKLETLVGRKFTSEERELAIKGELESLKETLDEQELRGVTVFFRDKAGMPCIGDHMIKGFLKAAAEAVARTLPKKNGTILNSASYTESIINQHVTIEQQFISFDKDVMKSADGSIKYCERSLRAMTAQGPRVSVAKSECIESGAALKFTLLVLENSPLTEEALKKLFSYGRVSGLGQWRNAGYGQFKCTIESA
jgi:CRISPR/Cas system CMR subunit Cmr6 (Cas7 group RAMP superfamily)